MITLNKTQFCDECERDLPVADFPGPYPMDEKVCTECEELLDAERQQEQVLEDIDREYGTGAAEAYHSCFGTNPDSVREFEMHYVMAHESWADYGRGLFEDLYGREAYDNVRAYMDWDSYGEDMADGYYTAEVSVGWMTQIFFFN